MARLFGFPEELAEKSNELCGFAGSGNLEAIQQFFFDNPLCHLALNTPSQKGQLALYCAANRGYLEIVSLILQYPGVDLDTQIIGSHDTALHVACSKNHAEIVALLLVKGANATIKNRQGQTAMQVASPLITSVFLLFKEGEQVLRTAYPGAFQYLNSELLITHTDDPLGWLDEPLKKVESLENSALEIPKPPMRSSSYRPGSTDSPPAPRLKSDGSPSTALFVARQRMHTRQSSEEPRAYSPGSYSPKSKSPPPSNEDSPSSKSSEFFTFTPGRKTAQTLSELSVRSFKQSDAYLVDYISSNRIPQLPNLPNGGVSTRGSLGSSSETNFDEPQRRSVWDEEFDFVPGEKQTIPSDAPQVPKEISAPSRPARPPGRFDLLFNTIQELENKPDAFVNRIVSNIDQLLVKEMQTEQPDLYIEFITKLCAKSTRQRLNIQARASLVAALCPLRFSMASRKQLQRIVEIIMDTEGEELTELKDRIDFNGGYDNLNQIIYDYLEKKERKIIISHIFNEGLKLTKQKDRLRPLKVLSDIDDTWICSGGSWPAGVDDVLPRRVPYPGVFTFYRELDLEGNASKKVTNQCSNFTFLSAKPGSPGGVTEDQSYKEFKKYKKFHTNPVLLAGDMGSFGLVFGTFDPIVEKKVQNFEQYISLYPDHRFIWIGDNGQGDYKVGLHMLETYENVLKVFIHRVIAIEDTFGLDKRQPNHPNIHFFDTYVGAAIDAYSCKLISEDGLVNVINDAKEDFYTLQARKVDSLGGKRGKMKREKTGGSSNGLMKGRSSKFSKGESDRTAFRIGTSSGERESKIRLVAAADLESEKDVRVRSPERESRFKVSGKGEGIETASPPNSPRKTKERTIPIDIPQIKPNQVEKNESVGEEEAKDQSPEGALIETYRPFKGKKLQFGEEDLVHGYNCSYFLFNHTQQPVMPQVQEGSKSVVKGGWEVAKAELNRDIQRANNLLTTQIIALID